MMNKRNSGQADEVAEDDNEVRLADLILEDGLYQPPLSLGSGAGDAQFAADEMVYDQPGVTVETC